MRWEATFLQTRLKISQFVQTLQAKGVKDHVELKPMKLNSLILDIEQ